MKKTQHQGRGQTLSELRANGYWIIGGSKAVAKYIRQCVPCRRARGPPEEQQMVDFPRKGERLTKHFIIEYPIQKLVVLVSKS